MSKGGSPSHRKWLKKFRRRVAEEKAHSLLATGLKAMFRIKAEDEAQAARLWAYYRKERKAEEEVK
jgi:hypothetical protein